jgi:2-oxoglutarate ferredoxin oxidoreductase subunit gamma
MRTDFRVVGSGGQGVIMSAVVLANAYGLYENFEIAQTQSYGPEARGGACKAELIISDEKIDYMKVDNTNIFIAYNGVGFNKYKNELPSDAVLFVDSTFITDEDLKGFDTVHKIEATKMAEDNFKPFVANVIMMGFMAAKLNNIKVESLKKAIGDLMPEKMHELNFKALDAGYGMGV